jgi:phosphate transport system substrate-binding protein
MKQIFFRFLIGALLFATSNAANAQVRLNGAGATFPFPIYSKWFSVYPKAQVNYQPVGSGAGVNQIKARTIDFGASDYPLSNDEVAQMPAPIVQMPTVGGAVAVTYNGLPRGLRMSGELIADIYLGKVTRWNDPRLRVLNPSLKLPNRAITVLRRSDGSGTTFIFTRYLSSVSREWREEVGSGRNVAWPVGMGGRGSSGGIAAMIKSTPFSIGYAELAFAVQQNVPYASVRNRDGQFVSPTPNSVIYAMQNSLPALHRDLRAPIVNARGAKTYPISGLTYLLFYRRQADKTKAKSLLDMLRWMNNRGQDYAKPLYYAPLPLSLRRINEHKISTLEKENGLTSLPPTLSTR